MTAISRNLQTLKEQRDTTQSAIASVAGASVGAVSKWFSGEKVPRLKYLDAISYAFACMFIIAYCLAL